MLNGNPLKWLALTSHNHSVGVTVWLTQEKRALPTHRPSKPGHISENGG